MRGLDAITFFSFLRCIPIAVVVACTALLLAACDSSPKPGDGASPPSTPQPARSINDLVGKWLLVTLLGEQVSITPPISMLIQADGTLSGRSAVNGYSGSLDKERLPSGVFEIFPIASTMMAGTPERMELEARYFRGLERARTWDIENGELILHEGEIEVARFKRASE